MIQGFWNKYLRNLDLFTVLDHLSNSGSPFRYMVCAVVHFRAPCHPVAAPSSVSFFLLLSDCTYQFSKDLVKECRDLCSPGVIHESRNSDSLGLGISLILPAKTFTEARISLKYSTVKGVTRKGLTQRRQLV